MPPFRIRNIRSKWGGRPGVAVCFNYDAKLEGRRIYCHQLDGETVWHIKVLETGARLEVNAIAVSTFAGTKDQLEVVANSLAQAHFSRGVGR